MNAEGLQYRLLVAVLVLLGGGCSQELLPEACSSHGSLRVGATIPSFAAVTETGDRFHSMNPWTNLTIYSVAQDHPDFSVDVGESVSSVSARKAGARVVRTKDGVVAGLFGMKVACEKPLQYDTAIVVICDTNCRVVRIWRSANVGDLDQLFKYLEVDHASNGNK